MLLTKKNILATIPAFREELLEFCPTPRHVRRLDEILVGLRKKKLILENRLRQQEGEEIKITVTYDKVAA